MPADGMIAAAEKGIRHIPRKQLCDTLHHVYALAKGAMTRSWPRLGRPLYRLLGRDRWKSGLKHATLNELNCEHTTT
jgi:hypothetical protein